MTSDWHRVSQLFHEALARDARDRAAFLDEACAGDGRLRQELDSLLEHERSVGAESMFESVIAAAAAGLAADLTPGTAEGDDDHFSDPHAALRPDRRRSRVSALRQSGS